ncbi:MAG TPA: hypothetical protein VMM15_20560 [Bradyrhizobium sp.]|nr:hypothetical protein [Bradyrhizobium sp.]
MEVAAFLEHQKRLGWYDDDGAPKLADAWIAGPTQDLSPRQPTYCVYVDLIMTHRILLATHDPLLAIVRFPPSEAGKQRIEGHVRTGVSRPSASSRCNDAPYTPFPELEHLRDQRRHALGKTDP